jgi:hypothetical protein
MIGGGSVAKMGRPEKQINKKQFESLCAIQCTYEEMCAVLDVTDKTLNKWCKRTYGKTFSDVFKEKRSLGKASLRRKGFEMAQKVPSVHIFYAKNFLGMSDKHEILDEAGNGKMNELIQAIKEVR